MIEIELNVVCKNCGNDLGADMECWGTVTVESCLTCIEDAFHEGLEKGEEA